MNGRSLSALILFILIASFACDHFTVKDESTQPDPWDGEALLYQAGGCQAASFYKTALVDSFSYQFGDDLILDFFVSSNCCPDTNRFELFSSVDEDTIAITVVDTAQHLCHCTCPYRIHTEFIDLPLDEYTVVVNYYGEVAYLEEVQRGFSSTGPRADSDLALYLLAVDTLNAYHVVDQPLGDLELRADPILSITDITHYEWSGHSFTVTAAAYERMEDVLGEYANHIGLRGAPFVITAGGERIYLGAFWNPVSSIPPPCPAITFPPLTEAPAILLIAEPWGDTYPDLRSDPRIYEALNATGVLSDNEATLQSLEVQFLGVELWLDLMPWVVPHDSVVRLYCGIDLEVSNTSATDSLKGLTVPDCDVELSSTGEFVARIFLTTEWDGILAPGETDRVRLTAADTLHVLAQPLCDADVTVDLHVNQSWQTQWSFESDPVEFMCTY
ncbi:MAG: hypothetical protein JSW54_02080 [Fidelibacterota bacterium]|nr:MAG: hypothetical protein JSW54_02080 [Candidatus Neomarinimicrobiota bacterium]